jgi:ABC-2 type transport system ATP-binding protein
VSNIGRSRCDLSNRPFAIFDAMAGAAVEVEDLRKSYGQVQAVRGVNLKVEHGEIFALLGPNGAGKTTIVEILEGYRKRDSGSVTVLGSDPAGNDRGLKDRMGIVLQETGVQRYLTVWELVELYGGYFTNPRPTADVLEVVGLSERAQSRIGKLSGGQLRRLDVAIGLVGDPDLLFLDEPTTGFDPSARRSAWKMIEDLQRLGKTILLTTHYMDEAQRLADRVSIIVDGRIVAEGTPESLRTRINAPTRITFTLPNSAPDLPPSLGGGRERKQEVQLESEKPMKLLHDLTGWALSNNIEPSNLSVFHPSLEDVYLELTSSKHEEAQT